MLRIEVLGTGSLNTGGCLQMSNRDERTRNVAEVIKVDDIDTIVNRGIILMPALFVDGRLRAEGRISCLEEIKEMITG